MVQSLNLLFALRRAARFVIANCNKWYDEALSRKDVMDNKLAIEKIRKERQTIQYGIIDDFTDLTVGCRDISYVQKLIKNYEQQSKFVMSINKRVPEIIKSCQEFQQVLSQKSPEEIQEFIGTPKRKTQKKRRSRNKTMESKTQEPNAMQQAFEKAQEHVKDDLHDQTQHVTFRQATTSSEQTQGQTTIVPQTSQESHDTTTAS